MPGRTPLPQNQSVGSPGHSRAHQRRSQQLLGGLRYPAKHGRRHGNRVPALGDRTGPDGIVVEPDGKEGVETLAEPEALLHRQGRTVAEHMVAEHEQSAELVAKQLFPLPQAVDIFLGRPVLPVVPFKRPSRLRGGIWVRFGNTSGLPIW